MKDSSINDFGLVIAYVLPGLTALVATTYVSNALVPWLGSAPESAPTVAGFLFVTLASIAAGLTVSTVRWLVLDTCHHLTGLPPPPRDFARLGGREAAFARIVEDHYRYYQFYGNMLVALALLFVMRHTAAGTSWAQVDWADSLMAATGILFFAGSRDALRKFYLRSGQLLHATGRRRT